jgi:transcription initiation factor TFIID subunit 13
MLPIGCGKHVIYDFLAHDAFIVTTRSCNIHTQQERLCHQLLQHTLTGPTPLLPINFSLGRPTNGRMRITTTYLRQRGQLPQLPRPLQQAHSRPQALLHSLSRVRLRTLPIRRRILGSERVLLRRHLEVLLEVGRGSQISGAFSPKNVSLHSLSCFSILSHILLVKNLMYGFGDDRNPANDTVNVMEEILIEYITDVVCPTLLKWLSANLLTPEQCQVACGPQRKSRLSVEDLRRALSRPADAKKLARMEELLFMQEDIKRARAEFEESDMNNPKGY